MPSAPAERERNDPTGDAHHPAAGATHAMPDGSVTAGAHHDHRAHAHPPAAKRPTAAAVAGKDAEYTCPMHPQVRQIGPGNCPICGMALEPVLATGETGESPELRDMTRRFWIGTALAAPVFVVEMGGHLFDFHHLVAPQTSNWIQLLLGTPVVLVGRVAILRARRGVGEEPQPEHVLADRARHRCGVAVQHRRHPRAAALSARTAAGRWRGADLLRGGGRHHGARAARPGARIARAREDVGRDQGAARPGAEDRGAGECRRQRRDGAGRRHPGRRAAARAPGRKGAGRRRTDRRQGQRRRVDGDRRADSGRQGGRLEGHRRDAQPDRRLRDARREGRRRHAAVADRAHGRCRAAQPRADPAHGRPGCRLVRSGRHPDRRSDLRRLARLGPAAGVQLCARQRRCRADHRVSVCARPGDADVDHGRRRQGRAARRADPRCRSARAHGEDRHAGARQDRNADRRPAEGRSHRAGKRLCGRRRAAQAGKRRARERTPAGARDRQRRARTQARAVGGDRFRLAARQGRHRHRRRRASHLRQRQVPRRTRHRRGAARSGRRDAARQGCNRHLRRRWRPARRLRRDRGPDQGDDAAGAARAEGRRHRSRDAHRRRPDDRRSGRRSSSASTRSSPTSCRRTRWPSCSG